MKLSIVFLMATLPWWHSAHATSFDCTKARSVAEKLICHDVDLSERDDELAVLHKRAKAMAPDQRAFNSESVRQWKLRESTCTDKICLLAWYDKRTAFLNELIKPPARATETVTANQCKVLGDFAGTVATARDQGSTEVQMGRLASEVFKDDLLLSSAVTLIHKIYTEPLLLAMPPARVGKAYSEQCRLTFR